MKREVDRCVRLVALIIVTLVSVAPSMGSSITVDEPSVLMYFPEGSATRFWWTAVNSSCNPPLFGVAVWLDGGPTTGGTSIVTCGASSFPAKGVARGYCEVERSHFGNLRCGHTITFQAVLWGPNSCNGSQTFDVWSEPMQVWLDDALTPSVRDGRPVDCGQTPPDCDQTTVAGPIDVVTGRMFYETEDLAVEGPLPIRFVRRYDSHSTASGALGWGWQLNFMMRLDTFDARTMVLTDAKMRRVFFNRAPGEGWSDNPVQHLQLSEGTDPRWTVSDKHGTSWTFDDSGRLQMITDRNDNTLTLNYEDGNLTSVTDVFGRQAALTYTSTTPKRIQMISAGNRSVTYEYSGTGDLIRAFRSAEAFETYEYEVNTHNLAVVRDALGRIVESHEYDTGDRVVHTESADDSDAYSLSYAVDNVNFITETTVTDARGFASVHIANNISGVVTQSTGAACSSCGGGGTVTKYEYDHFLNRTLIEDGEEVKTTFDHDANGNVVSRVEASGVVGFERETTYTYGTPFNLPLTVSTRSTGACATHEVVTNSYDASGNKLQEQVSGCNGDQTITATTSWTFDGHGQVTSVNGPRTDVPDVTWFAYYPDNHADLNRRGRLERVTNALNHQTNYSGYDYFGNVGTVTDPNGVETTFSYDIMSRPTEIRVHGASPAEDLVTQNQYDPVGNLIHVRQPNCVAAGAGCAWSVEHVYDAVNRLTEVRDSLGNKIAYTYDLMGNVTREESRDATGMARKSTWFSYDAYNRLRYTHFTEPDLQNPEDPDAVYFKYTYFDDGLLEFERDPGNHTTGFIYDPLKRLISTTQTVGAQSLTTSYAYDVQDKLESVTDPAGLVTTYANDDLGRTRSTVSPDTGTTSYTYDLAGNLLTSLDANGVTVSRSYDALNRLITTTYPDTTLNVTNIYDGSPGGGGIGRRTGMIDASGSTAFMYDRRGLLTSETKTNPNGSFVTGYEYDKNGNLTAVNYPSILSLYRHGRVDYTYDEADRVSYIMGISDRNEATIASEFAYAPFGPRTGMTFGNNRADQRGFDSRYQPTTWTLGNLLSYTQAYDRDGNLTSRTDHLDATKNRTFTYDAIHRLTGASGPWGPGTVCAGGTYTYDANGNRLCKGEGSPATAYEYVANTNKLERATGGESANYSYDANGNTVRDGSHSFEYNAANRLGTVDFGETASYTYDGDGRRVVKLAPKRTYYFYDPSGRLLTEMQINETSASGYGKDYVYLHGAPVARVDWTVTEPFRRGGDGPDGDDPLVEPIVTEDLLFYHTDHLGTPLAMTSMAGGFVWRAEQLPFGGIWSLPVSTVASNLRFPGQYFDVETGLAQNWFRDYSARTGRYSEADPFGLRDGTNLYGYAQANPVMATDPLGLAVWFCNRKTTWGVGNHGYLWDDRETTLPDRRSCGEGDNSGHEMGPQQPGVPPGAGDHCNRIDGSDGKEDALMACCEARREKQRLWAPFYDCHTLAARCIEEVGLRNPGAPGGRFQEPCCAEEGQ